MTDRESVSAGRPAHALPTGRSAVAFPAGALHRLPARSDVPRGSRP